LATAVVEHQGIVAGCAVTDAANASAANRVAGIADVGEGVRNSYQRCAIGGADGSV
jgi:hypothetical protein